MLGRGVLATCVVVTAVMVCTGAQDGRRAGTASLSSLVRALAAQESSPPASTRSFQSLRPSISASRSVNPRLQNQPARQSRFSHSPTSQSRFVFPTRDSLTARKQPASIEAEEPDQPQPKRPFATSNTQFRFGSSKPRTSPRKPFLPNDRVARFNRPPSPHQRASVSGTLSRPTIKTEEVTTRPTRRPIVSTRTTTTTTPAPATTTTTESIALTEEEYDYLGDYYDYYYYDLNVTSADDQKNLGIEDKKNLLVEPKKDLVRPTSPRTSIKTTPKIAFTTSETKSTTSDSSSNKLSLFERLSALSSKIKQNQPTKHEQTFDENFPVSKFSPVSVTTAKPRMEVSVTNTTESSFVVENFATSKTFLTDEEFMEDTTNLAGKLSSLDHSKPSLTSMFAGVDITPKVDFEENETQNISNTVPELSGLHTDESPVQIAPTEKSNHVTSSDGASSVQTEKTPSNEPSKLFQEPTPSSTRMPNHEAAVETESIVTNEVSENVVTDVLVSNNLTVTTEKDLSFAELFENIKSSNDEVSQHQKDIETVKKETEESVPSTDTFNTPSVNSTDANEVYLTENLNILKEREVPASLLPKGFVTSKESEVPASLLPEGFKIPEKSELPTDLLPEGFTIPEKSKVPASLLPEGFVIPEQSEVPASLLPPGFKIPEKSEVPPSLLPVDFKIPEKSEVPASLLPPGFKIPVKSNVPASLLPPGFKTGSQTESSMLEVSKKPEKPTLPKRKGLIFGNRGKKPATVETVKYEATTRVPPPLRPKIVNIFNKVKTSEKKAYVPQVTIAPTLLAELQAGAVTSVVFQAAKNSNTESTTTAPTTTTKPTTTTTTTTTTERPRPTTPGVCGQRCRLGGTIRIVGGAEWTPELANRDTVEWQQLAQTVTNELTTVYQRSRLNRWLVAVEVDSFNQGSVLVDYFLLLNDISTGLDTVDLKQMMNEMLENSNRAEYSLGPYTIDPEGTDFVVIKQRHRSIQRDDGGYLIPEWLIAVIVISLASFLFIIIFAITVLVSRARVRRRSVPLNEDTMNKLNASQMGLSGYDQDSNYALEAYWNEQKIARDMWEEKNSRDMRPPSSRGGYQSQYTENNTSHHPKMPKSGGDSWGSDWSGPIGSTSTAKRRPELTSYYGGAAGSSTYGDGGPYQRYEEDDDPYHF